MATLSSIPESNPTASQPRRRSARGRSIASFERVRPRSRVIILSRRPTRAKHRHRQQSMEEDDENEKKRQLVANMTQRWTKARDSRRAKFPPAGAISDMDLLNFERLVPSLDTAGDTVPDQSRPPAPNPAPRVPVLDSSLASVLGQDGYCSPTLMQKESSPSRLKERVSPGAKHEEAGPDDISRNYAASPVRVDMAPEINQGLVEAVARNVVQQLQLMSLSSQPTSRQHASPKPSSDQLENQSRTPSQRQALDHFANELRRYAQHTNAKGKLPVFTPTPARSGATLHTVAELLPFRPEFRAAGLAVTSKDQAKRPSYPTRANVARAFRRQGKPNLRQRHLSQMDGLEESGGTTTEISFVSPHDANDWRYALIDELPPRNKRNTAGKTLSKSGCFPCFPNDDDQTTDGGYPPDTQPNLSRVLASASSKKLGKAAKGPRTPSRLPTAESVAVPGSRSRLDGPSVRDISSNIAPNIRTWHNAKPQPRTNHGLPHSRTTPSLASRERAKPTGRRRPSMTLPWQGVPVEHQREMLRSQLPQQGWSIPPPNETQNVSLDYGTGREHAIHHSQLRDQNMPPQKIAQDLPEEPEVTGSMANLHSAFVEATLGIPFEEAKEATYLKPDMSNSIKETPKPLHRAYSHGTCSPTRRHPVTLCSRTISSRLRARPNIPKRTSSIRGSLRSVTLGFPSHEVVDRDVLRGLHIAVSAACDEEIDEFICSQTGLQIRRFLADLIPFETLGDERRGESREERVSRRRSEMRRLKQSVRRSREIRKASMMTT